LCFERLVGFGDLMIVRIEKLENGWAFPAGSGGVEGNGENIAG
jgi:hypothetical protein